MQGAEKLKVALRVSRTSTGRKLLLGYLLAKAFGRPIAIRLGEVSMKLDRDRLLMLILVLDNGTRREGPRRAQEKLLRLWALASRLREALKDLAHVEDATLVWSAVYLDRVAEALVGMPVIEDGYVDFRLNYFGRATYTIGLPISLAETHGIFLADDAAPRPSIDGCKPMSSECPYYVGDLTGAEVLDVGGYIGDSALYFYALGARHVKVYEPFFHEVARRNLRVNGLPEDVEPYAVGDGSRMCAPGLASLDGTIAIPCKGVEVGPNAVCAEGRRWQEVLDRAYDLVKVDCEGCERYLLDVPCDYIRRGRRWIIEVHDYVAPGLFNLLVSKFQSCGFSVSSFERDEPGEGMYELYAL